MFKNLSEFETAYKKLDFDTRAQDRLDDYYAGEKVDNIPYVLFESEVVIGESLGYTTRMVSEDFNKTVEIIEIKKTQFGLEDMYVGNNLRTMGQAIGSKVRTQEHGPDVIIDYVLDDYNNFCKLKLVNPSENEILSAKLEYAQKLRERFPELALNNSVKGPFSTATGVRPAEKILKDTIKNKKELHELLEFCLACCLEWVKVFYKEFGPTTVNISDPAICGNLLGKKHVLEFGLPYFKRLYEGIKEITNGCPVELHICGQTKHLWNDIKEMGFKFFSIDNCEKLSEAKDIMGNDVMIAGNIPPMLNFKNGDINDMIKTCQQAIYDCGDSPKGFVLMGGCDVPPGSPIENIKAFVYSAKTYGSGATKGNMPEGMESVCE